MTFLKKIEQRAHIGKIFSRWQVQKKIEIPGSFTVLLFTTFETCFRYYDILGKTRGRMTMAITFSRQNDGGSRARNTQY